MEEFLKKLKLSDKAIAIYLRSLGQSYLTYNELYSFVSEITPENFSNLVNELIDNGVLIQIAPQSPEILLHFLAIPPFQLILDYFYRNNGKISDIVKQVNESATNSINKNFNDYKTVVADFNKSFQEIRKDITEDSLIQKQEVEEIVKKFENLKKINEELIALKDQTKGSMVMQLSNLMENFNTVKSNIIAKVKNLKIKRIEEEVTNIIEQEFITKLGTLGKEYSSEILETIEEKFNNANPSINNILNKAFEFRDEFKALYLSAISNFEFDINKFQTLIKSSKDLPKDETTNLIISISKDLSSFISNSLKQFSGLNKPIESIIEQFLSKIKSTEGISINNIWFINSRTKMYEEIQNLMENSKESLYLIVPKLEDYISIDPFRKLSMNLKIKIAASNATTDEVINQCKKVRNFEYKSIQNNDIVVLKGDDNHIVIGIEQNDSKDELKNIIGFGSNFTPMIKLLSSIIETKWELDKVATKTVYQPKVLPPIVIEKKPIINHSPPNTIEQQISPKVEVPKEVPKHVVHEPQVTPQKVEPLELKASVQPKEKDEPGILINNAFNMLIEKIDLLNGIELSKELEKISDIILNSRGFSITMHDIRKLINQYKMGRMKLSQHEKNEILVSIQNWKEKLL